VAALAPSDSSAATVRPDGLLDVDGKPFFPVGLVDVGYWRYPTDWNDHIRRSGANVVWDIGSAYADTIPTCRALVDSAVATGYKLIVGSGDTWNWDDPATPELEVDKMMYEPADLPAFLGCLDAAPGLVLGYANRDEPAWTINRSQVGDIDQAHVLETYDQLHQDLGADFVAMNFGPTHLSGSLDLWKQDVTPYLDATDVVMHASYPYPAGPGTCTSWNVMGYPECSLDRLATAADLFLSEMNKPGQPLWMIVQTHKSIPLQEARWEAYTAIVHGATGVLWAGWTWWHTLGHGWDNWDVAEQVISEVAALQPYLVGTDLSITSPHPDIELRAKQSGRNAIVMAISRNGFTGSVKIPLPSLQSGVQPVSVLNEQRFTIAKSGAVTDHFAPYEAHVYQYRLKPGVSGESGDGPLGGAFSVRAVSTADGRATLRFSLPAEASLLATVYDAAGRRVAVAGRGTYAAGAGEITWNGRNLDGQRVAPGMYFLRARTSAGDQATAKVLIRP
jgi:hypothetical protein